MRSRWDTLHRGRPEVAKLPEREESFEAIVAEIAKHRRMKEGADERPEEQ